MKLVVRDFGICEYLHAYHAMVAFNADRDSSTADEIWFMQHRPVYTLGMAGKSEHILNPGAIPVIKTDRGGQVTYHGPGQLLGYTLLDLKRSRISIKGLVEKIEQSIIDMLDEYGIQGHRQPGAPGVYVEKKKIAALGIRVRNGCSYHGFSMNIDMDLRPYLGINPCGYPGMEVTQLRELVPEPGFDHVISSILPRLCQELGYNLTDIIMSGVENMPLIEQTA